MTFDIPYEEYDRLKAKKGLAGVTTPVSDIAMIFLTNVEPVMLDKNVRLAACHAIDKKLLVDRLLKGYGVPIDTLQAPQYSAFDPTTKVSYDPELSKKLLAASGYSPEKPAKFTIQTTKGFKPKDFEIIQAIVGMWRKVGIEANIEVYEIAKHFELRFGHKLAPAAFYNWGNSIGDPSTSTGFAMFGPSPHCAWKSDDLVAKIGPLWGEPDEAKRIAGYKAVDKYIAEEGYVIPLFQYVQPIVYASSVKVTPNLSGAVLPQLIRSGVGIVRPAFENSRGPPVSGALAGPIWHRVRSRPCASPRRSSVSSSLVVTFFGVAVVVFVLVRVAPGDPIAMMIAPGASAEGHRRPARALRARQVDPDPVRDLARPCPARRFRHVDLAAPERHRSGARPLAGDARTRLSRSGDRRCARRRHGGHGGALARNRDRGGRRSVQRRRPADPRFPLGPDLHSAVRRRDPDLRYFRPRLAVARTAVRHAVLSHRKHRAAALRSHRSICSAIC